ncbi:transporter substrate-binding domain-containing protein [Pseudomonas lalucatii]|uniref:Transporter substrate-binding domain-containing protein n=1 Tax=Pseudomonas lalucatii TaxID=1424203 RepID=A0ABS5PXM0_9PSED|nr:transporter substrate-binding domain-containing protein [Pseudomonas lalucatii]MBS7724426.1 transporter substrate-binding domain-containing protein [Pseudomonas lalucatii]QVM87585.1 transporter substrate-binding domain-containing protein [Pseudomonas lalucatii]
MKPIRVCSLFAVLLATGVRAESYVVGVEDLAFAPHYSIDKQGQYQGFARELLDAFAAHSGVALSYRPLPVTRLLPALLAGEVDLKYPDNANWAQAQKTGNGLAYSQPVVGYVDGVLVAPRRQGQPLERLKRLALVDGWTPWGYQERIDAKQIELAYSDDLRKMIHQALKKDTDGVYFNVVVATHYLDNIRARPGALVFDPKLPHTRGTFHLSTLRHPALLQRFDRFLIEQQDTVAALRARYRVEANLDSEYMGMEQWKVEFLERQKAKAGAE